MAQHDYVVANASGATVRGDINDALSALVSINSGAAAPATTYAYMLWADTTSGLLKQRNSTNASWVTVGTLDATYLGLGSALPGYIHGLGLSNNGADATNDIDIALGQATSDDAAAADRVLMVLASGLTKKLDVGWSVGTNQGGLDTGAIANTSYHTFLIQRPDTGVVDVLFSASPTAPTMPANYTKKRRIGSFRRVGATIVPFYQRENTFYIKTPLLDVNPALNPGATLTTQALAVPTGVIFEAILGVLIGGHASASLRVLVSPIACGDVAPEGIICSAMSPTPRVSAELQYGSGIVRCMTDTSAQVQYHCSASDATTLLQMTTFGWIDTF